jgi:hypothetical protein
MSEIVMHTHIYMCVYMYKKKSKTREQYIRAGTCGKHGKTFALKRNCVAKPVCERECVCNKVISPATVCGTSKFISTLHWVLENLNKDLLEFSNTHCTSTAHATSLKINILLSQLIRVYRLSADLETAGYEMRMFMQLMIKLRRLPPRKARLVWRKFKIWLSRQNKMGHVKMPPTDRPVTLWLTKNVGANSFCKAIERFIERLPPQESRKLLNPRTSAQSASNTRNRLFKASKIRVQHLSEKCLGLRVFVTWKRATHLL